MFKYLPAVLIVLILWALAVEPVRAQSNTTTRNNLASTWQPWPWTGWKKFPSLYFAAEREGFFSANQMRKISKFSLEDNSKSEHCGKD